MNLQALPKQIERFVRSNSPAILTGIGVTGTVTTAYLAYRVGYEDGHHEGRYGYRSLKVKVKEDWKTYIPPVATGTITIACIIGATKIGNRRTAALAAAYSISERAFSEYKDKVTEKLGERKEQSVRDDIAQDRIASNPIGREVMLVGGGTVLCCELHTGRYFLSDMDSLKKAQNEVNDRILKCDYATLSEFYTLIGLSPTQNSADYGWDQERGFLSLGISTALMDDTRPCLAFDYNYLKSL